MEHDPTCPDCRGEDRCYCDLEGEGCWRCYGVGGWHDCGEDSCCCLHPDDEDSADWWICPECDGAGEIHTPLRSRHR